MRKLTLALLAVAALATTSDLASARDGCGRGMFWNGYACVPTAPRAYGPGPGYGGPGPRMTCTYVGCCPRGYSVQDGVCKPYRGY